jgi:hypothetical protein
MQVTLQCSSPQWRADLKTLLASGNEVTLTGFSYWLDGFWCEAFARNQKSHFTYSAAEHTALFTRN